MKSLINVAKFLFLLSIISCNNKVDSFGLFTVYKKLDDNSTNILVIKGEKESYTFSSSIKFDLKSLVNYNCYLVDKSGAYRKYEIDGDILIIPLVDIDLGSFEVIKNSIYSKDKNFVYDCRNGKLDSADVNSFEKVNIKELKHVTGKDKNYFYFWNEKITDSTEIYNCEKYY